jgi:caa(3)-type oxidase subunit IV
MHSDPAEMRKSVRTYLMVGAALYVGTVITVAVNQVHLAVPLAITVALIVASIKGSLVGGVFMHLNHERKWIYGSLILTVVGFLVLMSVPYFTISDGIGTPIHHEVAGAAHAAAERH